MASLALDASAIRHLLNDPLQPVQRHLGTLARRTKVLASIYAGKDTTALANSITEEFHRDAISFWTVIARVPHATVHHEGSKPHIIRARNKQALHFYWKRYGNLETFVPRAGANGGRAVIRDGILVIGKGFVNHPGTQPNPYLLRALTEVVRSP